MTGGTSRSAKCGSAAIGHVLLDDPGVAVAKHHGAARIADELGAPLDHAVTLALGRHLHLAGARHLEALLGAALGLQLGHLVLLCLLVSAKPTGFVIERIQSRHGMPSRAARAASVKLAAR